MKYKYDEDRYLDEMKRYIDSTYSSHYTQGDEGIQSMEYIRDTGFGEGFCAGNILKYVGRYGKKNGKNRDDLLKVIHYSLLLLHEHDRESPIYLRSGEKAPPKIPQNREKRVSR